MPAESIQLIERLLSLANEPGFPSSNRIKSEALELSRQVTRSLQGPHDAAIELCLQPMFTVAARVAVDLNLFRLIAASSESVSAAHLASASGASESLIIRLLRPLSSLGFVKECGPKQWTSTSITAAMCNPPIEAAHVHGWDQGTTSATKMPAFFRQAGYRDPQDPKKGILQFSLGTDRGAFEHWLLSPDVLNNFNTFMTGVRGSRLSWVHWWPVESRILQGAKEDKESVLFVDVGGGLGNDAREFKATYPHSKGKIILQDLPAIIDSINRFDSDIEPVKYDFFAPQPTQGARVYFFHFIMHDWPDNACLSILTQTAGAMKKGYSKLLLNEFILPDEGCPLFLSGFDLQMMTMHAGKERTESQWKTLLSMAGLHVISFSALNSNSEGIIEAELA